MSTQMSEAEQPIPARLYVSVLRFSLKRLTSMEDMEGVGAKQLQAVITIPICTKVSITYEYK